MERKVLLAVICWLTLSEALGEADKTVKNSVADNESAESAPRLYQNIPVGVYASGTPYGSYSFHTPTVISAPIAASQLASQTVVHNTNGFLKNLKDSYGKYVETPHTTPYKSAFPQQFVKLQELPAHLSQPLIASAPSFQYKQTAPHFFAGSQQYRIPSLHQAATPTPITRFGSYSQPLVYAENIRSFAPSSRLYTQLHNFPTFQQQLTNTKPIHADAQTIQRLQESPKIHAIAENKDPNIIPNAQVQASNNENGQIQAAPAQTSVTAIVNGKKTVITLDTNPPVPLLDLNLLEPLTFDNPLVPQVQHFLPRINSATYHTLPNFNINNVKKPQKEIFVQKTKSYDSGIIVGKPKNESPNKKKQNKPRPQNSPAKPSVTVKGSPNGSPEISYEIDTPNYKETYNEQVLSYNKETNMEPVHYSYNEKTHKEPVTYSYVRSSKEPLQVKHVEYESDPDNPKQLLYKFTPEEQDEEQNEEIRKPSSQESEDSGESSAESDDEGPASQPQRVEHHDHHEDSPRHQNSNHHNEHQGHHNEKPRYSQQYSGNRNHHEESTRHPQHHGNHHHHTESSSRPRHHSSHHGHDGPPSHAQHHRDHQEGPRHSQHHGGPPRHAHHHDNHDGTPKHNLHRDEIHDGPPRQVQGHGNQREHHDSPRQSHQLHPEHREEYRRKPNQEIQYEVITHNPQVHAQPLTVTLQSEFQPITPEYEEDIRLLPPHRPNAPIKVDPSQHVQLGPSTPYEGLHASSAPQKHAGEQREFHDHSPTHIPYSSPSPHILEKSKRVIIKEKEETPDEMRVHAEQLMEQMIQQEENNEQDFEKAYKESAFGFPAYEETTDTEKDIYDPDTYGAPRGSEYDFENTPFQQYQVQGDEGPKFARLTYKDSRDKTKDDYFSEYSASKPDSFSDHYRKKEDYYKTYKKNRPEKLFADENGGRRKQKQKEKYIIAAPSFVYPAPAKLKPKQYFARFTAAPKRYEYDYSKQTPRDSSAYASHTLPFHRHKTHFVEPQFQYGFEPIAAPLVIDSELAAMASNDSPESEKPGLRKKIYKENWYIKKTSTLAGKPS